MARRIAFVANALSGQELQAGKNDASRVYAAMLDRELGACSSDSPPPLHDCASRTAYEDQLLRAIEGWRDQDQLILYFSGHGKVVRGKYALIFGGDATQPVLPFDNIIADLQTHGVTRAILILDACESGAIVEPGMKAASRFGIEGDELPKGMALLASSRRRENSYEISDRSASLFTHLLLAGIESGLGHTSTHDNLIGIGDIYVYIDSQLASEPYASYPQKPTYSIHGAARDIWIAKNKTHNAKKAEGTARSIDELRFLYERTEDSRHPCPGVSQRDLSLELLTTFSTNAKMGVVDTSRIDEELRRLGLHSPIQPEQLHKAAVLCFASRPDVFMPQARSILVIGNRLERGFQRQDIMGPLPVQYRQLIDGVENALARQGLERGPVSQLFFSVVRESISNAIAHRDYTRNGAVRVSVQYPSVEVVSPGGFPDGRTWLSLLHGEHASSPVDAAIAWYLTTTLAFEGVGRGFEVFEEYINTVSESHLECDEVAGSNVRLRITLREDLTARRMITPRLPSRSADIAAVTPIANPLDTVTPGHPSKQEFAKLPLGRYDLLQTTNQGGMGSVYVAVDNALNRKVAIKVLSLRFESSRSKERFLRESAATAALTHPGIVRIYDIGTTDDQVYIIMQLVDGGTLQDWIEHHAYDPPRYFHDAAAIIAQVADALAYAHAQGVIHRDIQPHNILLDREEKPYIADFGIATILEADGTPLTPSGVLFNAPTLMSPEHAVDTPRPDHQADVYSLGVVFWAMLTRQHPFRDASSFMALGAKQSRLQAPSEVNPDVPTVLDAITLKATSMNSADRYSAADMAKALNAYVQYPAGATEQPGVMEKHVILFLAANPLVSTPRTLDEECAAIQREIEVTPYRDDFQFVSRWAVSIDELMRHLNELSPTIIHFSGQGEGESALLLHDEQGRPQPVPARALAMMLDAAARNVRVVVLNACYSVAQAEALRTEVDCVVGMDGAVGAEAARAFATRFYGALGNRRSVGNALDQAVAALAAKQLPDEVLPRCTTRDGIDKYQVVLGSLASQPSPGR